MMYFLRHFEALRNLQLSRDCLGTFFFFFFFFGDRIRSAHDSFLVVSVSVRLHAVCVPGWSIATSPGCKCCFHVLFRVVTSYSALEGCRIPECCSGYRCTGRGGGGTSPARRRNLPVLLFRSSGGVQGVDPLNHMDSTERLKWCQNPKLHVAVAGPVSRSVFSTTDVRTATSL